MNQKMSTSEKFGALLNDVCDGTVTETQIQELEVILESDVTARKAFADHFQLLTDIRFLGQVERARNVGLAGVRATLPQTTQSSSPTLPQVFLTNIIHGPVGFYSGWPVAYLIATVIFGIGALIGSVTYVSHPGQIAERLPVVITGKLASEPQMEFVGRITGMVDCQWADASTEAVNGAYVPLGRKYALSSGLMEITYDTGAKVIVQGPVTYEVESAFGGYLAVGKLTARVDKKEDHRSTSKSPNPTLFTIKTPTATVTDLGTEFGVEVDESGTTQSHVFRGLVRVQRLADGGKPEETGQLLRENESARVERSGQGRIVVVPAGRSFDLLGAVVLLGQVSGCGDLDRDGIGLAGTKQCLDVKLEPAEHADAGLVVGELLAVEPDVGAHVDAVQMQNDLLAGVVRRYHEFRAIPPRRIERTVLLHHQPASFLEAGDLFEVVTVVGVRVDVVVDQGGQHGGRYRRGVPPLGVMAGLRQCLAVRVHFGGGTQTPSLAQ